jgi:hypothetical protein
LGVRALLVGLVEVAGAKSNFGLFFKSHLTIKGNEPNIRKNTNLCIKQL